MNSEFVQMSRENVAREEGRGGGSRKRKGAFVNRVRNEETSKESLVTNSKLYGSEIC